MNCETVRAWLDAATLGSPDALAGPMRSHLDRCPDCRRVWAAQRRVATALAAVTAPTLLPGSADRLLAMVFAADARRHRPPLRWAAAAVVVFGLILGFTLKGFPSRGPGYALRRGTLIVPSVRPTTVGVAFDASAARARVRFTIDLPAGMAVAGQHGAHHVSWTGSLRKGRNLLKLPVIARVGAQGLLTAELNWGSGHRTFRLPVRAVDPLPRWHRL